MELLVEALEEGGFVVAVGHQEPPMATMTTLPSNCGSVLETSLP